MGLRLKENPEGGLKEIEAYIRHEKLDDVKAALKEIGIVGMNVVDVHGHGRQGGIVLSGRQGSYTVDVAPPRSTSS